MYILENANWLSLLKADNNESKSFGRKTTEWKYSWNRDTRSHNALQSKNEPVCHIHRALALSMQHIGFDKHESTSIANLFQLECSREQLFQSSFCFIFFLFFFCVSFVRWRNKVALVLWIARLLSTAKFCFYSLSFTIWWD